MPSILVVDPRSENRDAIRRLLAHTAHVVREAASVCEALAVAHSTPIDVVLMDRHTGGGRNGLELVARIKAATPDTDVVVLADAGSIPEAVEAIKHGAHDYLTRPLDAKRLMAAIGCARQHDGRTRGLAATRAEADDPAHRLVAGSSAMQELLAKIAKFATSASPVLLTGESGTGKELVVRLLHRRGPRRRASFVPINCGAIPETLIESELFGHCKGAFTGAVNERRGLFEEAHGGVVFLDEIGDMPLTMQVRLLRFLEDGEVRRVGGTMIRHVDARVVAATNRPLEDAISQGRFREDLYYRISMLLLRVPPLRERVADIPGLAQAHLRRVATRAGLTARGLAPAVVTRLEAYRWPGNVRELHSVIEHAAHNTEGDLIEEADLPEHVVRWVDEAAAAPRESDDRARLRAVMEQCRWHHLRAAAALGISRTTLWRRLRRAGLSSEWNG